MNNPALRIALRFVLVLLVQVLILNNIQFSGYINPYFYLWFVMLLPLDTPGWLMLIMAFLLGLGVDLFPQGISGPGSSLGIHAAATVLVAFSRPMILKWIGSGIEYDQKSSPDGRTYGWVWFAMYTLVMVTMHHLVLFIVEDFSLVHFFRILLRILLSVLVTSLLILIWEAIKPGWR